MIIFKRCSDCGIETDDYILLGNTDETHEEIICDVCYKVRQEYYKELGD